MQTSLFDTHQPEPYRVKPEVKPVLPEDESRVKLRSTQPLAISLAREQIAAKKNRGIIAAPCGFGKSVVACAFIEAAIKRGSKVWFVVDRQNLVTQMSAHLDSFGIDHAVMMSQHWRWNPANRVQVVSIQTIEKRGWDEDIQLMIVDEAHANLRKSFLAFIEKSPETKVIGITATPFHKEIGKAYEFVVNPTTVNKQIEEGFLTPLRIFRCVEADMTGAKTSGGEWTDEEVRTRGQKIIGDIVTTWIDKTHEVFGKPVKTIIFPSTIAHGQEIAAGFAQHGYNFRVVHCKDSTEDKEGIIADFKREDTQYHGLISCGVLTRGFDVTDIQIGIMARPFRKAFSEFIQQLGRIQRAHPWEDGTKKEFGLLLDHASNVARFLPEMVQLFENGVDSLADPPDAKPPRKEPTKKEKKEMFCPKCHKLWDSKGDTCSCGYVRKRTSTVEVKPGQMKEVFLGKTKLADDKRHLWEQVVNYTRQNGKPETMEARAYYAYRDMTGADPPKQWQREFHEIPPSNISRAVKNEFMRKRLAYIKAREKG